MNYGSKQARSSGIRWPKKGAFWVLMSCISMAQAEEHADAEDVAISGYLYLLLGGSETKSLTEVSDHRTPIQSLNQAAKAERTEVAALFWEVSYFFNKDQTAVYLGSIPGLISDRSSYFGIGIKQRFENGTDVNVGLIPPLSLFNRQVWQDPYQLKRKRQKTDLETAGVRLAVETLMGSPWSFYYGYTHEKVSQERSGESALEPLERSARAALKRSGDQHSVEVDYVVPLSESFFIVPRLQFIRANAQGKAFRYDRAGSAVTLLYQQDTLEFDVTVNYSVARFEERHPVFNRVRKDEGVSVQSELAFIEPFGWKSVRVSGLFQLYAKHSNIRFYNEESILAGIGLSYFY
ncbi:DUF2860 family protein [Oleiphilus messinensis]|nr:DUF2860 family protein [Oleiphilus messinensis]